MQQCSLKRDMFPPSLLLGWLSHGNKLERLTLSENIPTDAQVNTCHYFSVQAWNQSFRRGVICLADIFTVKGVHNYVLWLSVSANLCALCCFFLTHRAEKTEVLSDDLLQVNH